MGQAGEIPFLQQAVVVSGHMVDRPERAEPRFDPSSEPVVTRAIARVLQGWDVGPRTLLVSGASRGTDIIAAEQALDLGAEVWLLVATPEKEFVRESVQLPGTEWEQRYRALRERCPTRFQHDELGPAASSTDAFERNNAWMLDVARATTGQLRALVVWDGSPGDGPGGTADFVERARKMGANVVVIDPLSGQVTEED